MRHGLPHGRRTVVLLPGSRPGEALRHLPVLLEAVAALKSRFDLSFVLATPAGFRTTAALQRYREPISALAIKVLEGETWNAIGFADLALAASGTVTVETAILGVPMVTFYKVTPLTWHIGRRLVEAPFLTMVNLIAGRKIVPEFMQDEMTGASLADAATELLKDNTLYGQMQSDLVDIRRSLTREGDPLARAAEIILANGSLDAQKPLCQGTPAHPGRE
jgi:lipid-A-disaccharide synthase